MSSADEIQYQGWTGPGGAERGVITVHGNNFHEVLEITESDSEPKILLTHQPWSALTEALEALR